MIETLMLFAAGATALRSVFWAGACLVQASIVARRHGIAFSRIRSVGRTHPARVHLRDFIRALIVFALALFLCVVLGTWFPSYIT